jgi:twitching motility protein PilU
MNTYNPDDVMGLFHAHLREMEKLQASDLYFTVGYTPSIRISDTIELAKGSVVTRDDLSIILDKLLSPKQKSEFKENLELNFPIILKDGSRFRANLFQQQGVPGLVIRRINLSVPTLEELELPRIYGDMILKKRGLVVLASSSGSGKSTSMAAMLAHRNRVGKGHILTIEDPIEFIHSNGNCIFTQREVGVDTLSFENALNNALRQKADGREPGSDGQSDVEAQAVRSCSARRACGTDVGAFRPRSPRHRRSRS